MEKWCFLGLFFWGFSVIVVCFWCVWHSSRSVKNACFSQFFGLLRGGLFLLILGLEGLGVFVFLVFVLFFVLLLFLFCLLCFCFVVGLVLVLVLVLLLFLWFFVFFLFCSCFVFVFVVFCFLFGGFKGQVRWPKGPPHLALNPPYFLFVCFWCLFFFFAFLSLFFVMDKNKPVFPLKKGTFCLFFSVSLCFSLTFLGLPPLSSLSLSLSLSCSFLSSFLPVFHFLFLVLVFFCCVCFFLFQDVLLFLLFCLLSCVVLNHNISFIFALHLVFWLLLFFVLVAFIFCYFLIFGNLSKNISEKHGNSKNSKNQKCRKKNGHFDRSC